MKKIILTLLLLTSAATHAVSIKWFLCEDAKISDEACPEFSMRSSAEKDGGFKSEVQRVDDDA